MTYSFLDLAYDVLNESMHPLVHQEIWRLAEERGLTVRLETVGKTPWRTLGARLYVEVRDNDASKFIKVGARPARFFLKDKTPRDCSEGSDGGEYVEEKRKAKKRSDYHERDLHPLLTYFAYANPSFNRGRSIHTKTILHEKSSKGGYNEWIHPDMVGFYLPIEDWRPNVIEFNRLSDNNALRLFSFEIKKSLTRTNYRESYFQAVSNSSWAHEGYLVAAEILEDDEFLASSFGIGVIHLDPADIDASRIVYPARVRPTLDWETINKLCELNHDFDRFLSDVKIDFESKKVHRAEYDEVVRDITQYVRDKLKIGQAVRLRE